MRSSTLEMPRLSRAKALFGTLATVIALTGAVQAGAPASASAQQRRSAAYCSNLLYLTVIWCNAGSEPLVSYFMGKWDRECAKW